MVAILLEERKRVHEQLCQWIEDDPRRLAVLADLVIAIPLGRSPQSPDLAENIIRDVQDQSIAQMLRRFYMNDAITWEKFYVPILRQLPGRLNLKVYFLVADTTDIGQGHRALVLSLAYHKRSLPLIWHVEPGSKGHTGEDLQVELLKRLYTHLPFDGLVIFLGDGEFDGVKVQPLSSPLQAGVRFLHHPLPAVPSARLTARFPLGENYGLTTFHSCTRTG